MGRGPEVPGGTPEISSVPAGVGGLFWGILGYLGDLTVHGGIGVSRACFGDPERRFGAILGLFWVILGLFWGDLTAHAAPPLPELSRPVFWGLPGCVWGVFWGSHRPVAIPGHPRGYFGVLGALFWGSRGGFWGYFGGVPGISPLCAGTGGSRGGSRGDSGDILGVSPVHAAAPGPGGRGGAVTKQRVEPPPR